MEPAMWGLIGTLVGAAASLFATYTTNAHSAKQNSEARIQDRHEKFREFQRETLLELQVAIQDVMRTVFLVHLEDTKGFVSGGDWGSRTIPDKLSEEDADARRRIGLYVERVADDSVRGAVKQLMAEVNLIMRAASKAEADRALNNFTSKSTKVIELVGCTLRATY